MNVLFIAYHAAFSPLMESQGLAYMSELNKKGADYSLLTFEPPLSVSSSREFISRFKGIKWRHLKYHKKYRFLATCFDIAAGMLMTAMIIRKDKIDIIHARGLIPAVMAIMPARMFGKKIFFDTRGLLAEKYVGGGLLRKNSLAYKLMRWGEDSLVEKSDFITVETYSHERILQTAWKGNLPKMDVIPCCVDLMKFNYINHRAVKKELNIIYLGKAGTWYLLDEMFDFFKMITNKLGHARFTIITQDDPGCFLPYIKNKGLDESRIIFKKPKREDLPKLMATADAGIFFINPYKRYNSSPIKFGEYLACGLPAIVNKGIGDCDEIILRERVGVIIEKFDPDEYEKAALKLEELLSDGPALRKRCREAAEKHLSLDMGVEKYWNVYKALLPGMGQA